MLPETYQQLHDDCQSLIKAWRRWRRAMTIWIIFFTLAICVGLIEIQRERKQNCVRTQHAIGSLVDIVFDKKRIAELPKARRDRTNELLARLHVVTSTRRCDNIQLVP